MIRKAAFPLRLYQQTEPAKSAKGSLSASYAELTPMSQLIEYDPLLMTRIADYSCGYSPIFGSLELRQRIADYAGVGPDSIIVTNGIDDAMPSLFEALLVPAYEPIPERHAMPEQRL